MRRINLSIAVLALALIPLAAVAAEEKPSFEEADKNGDGAVSIKEAEQSGIPTAEAKGNDLDGNGKLTQGDWSFVDMSEEETSSS
ncbi:hypothetical protein QWY84_12900 [Aquisalimonas lutea]|uniref:hypothetical protein n=1 Tax=Aquisalimonas lutea TaxID=1327750 RepID=UPI0025B420E8|nr:hypothetical protein [Aquisalimonas lutea]MDN3518513.1 hypothetical protein [Aquisalimonas lutea]